MGKEERPPELDTFAAAFAVAGDRGMNKHHRRGTGEYLGGGAFRVARQGFSVSVVRPCVRQMLNVRRIVFQNCGHGDITVR